MHLSPSRRSALLAALDQVFFFLVVLVFTYVAIVVCAWGRAPLARYLVVVLFLVPIVVVSAICAAQLRHREPPPVARRNRLALREIRPQEPPRTHPRRAA